MTSSLRRRVEKVNISMTEATGFPSDKPTLEELLECFHCFSRAAARGLQTCTPEQSDKPDSAFVFFFQVCCSCTQVEAGGTSNISENTHTHAHTRLRPRFTLNC